jgi:uncharacterized protein YdcH (DUF465 family)
MDEKEIVRILGSENDEFRKLGEEHRRLEEKLTEYRQRVYLSPDEQLEKKKVKKLKLQKKDRMAEIVRRYKSTMSLN